MQGKELREQLHRGGRMFGIHTYYLGGPQTAHHYSSLDLDFVFIDTEHIPIDRKEVSWMCRYYRSGGISPLVRISYPNGHLAAMAIDGGAEGIIAPYLETVEEVKEVVGAVKYRPLKGKILQEFLDGKRRLKPETLQYLENYNLNQYLLIGIESVPAYENLDALIAVAGVDGVFIGPHDLSVSMELSEQYTHPDYVKTVTDIIERARKAGLGVGLHIFPHNVTPETLNQYLKAGMNWILYSSDALITKKAVEKILLDLKSQ